MPTNRAAIWLVVFSMMLPWVSAAVAEAPAADGQEELRGVVIEEIPKGSALEKAGLQVGDVILSWERLPNPPTNPEAAQGELNSYFDWLELAVEQVPRGAVILRGFRSEAPVEFRVEPGLWEATARPVLAPLLEKIYLEGEAWLASGGIEAAVRIWESMISRAGHEGRGDLRAWVNLWTGAIWVEREDWKKAIESFRAAYDASASPASQIAALKDLGEVYRIQKEFETAEAMWLSALKIQQNLYPEGLGVATLLNDLGLVVHARGNLDSANSYYLQALRLNDRLAPQSLSLTVVLGNLGTLARFRGDLESAHEYFLRSLLIQEQLIPQTLYVASSLNNLGVVAWARDELDDAHDYFLRSIHIREQLVPNTLSLATSFHNIGFLSQLRGNLVDAHDYFFKALRIRELLAPQSIEVAGSLNNLGYIAHLRGELDSANNYYERALQLERKLAPEGPAMAAGLSNLGAVARDRGEVSRAHEYLLQALAIDRQIAPKSIQVAASLNNLGAVARALGDLDRASDYHLQALQICQTLASQGLELAKSLNHLGVLARARGDLDLAHELHSQALRHLQSFQIREQLESKSLGVATTLSRLGDIARDRGALDRAEDYYRQALSIEEQIAPQNLDLAITLRHLGTIARSRGKLDYARKHYNRALEVLEHQSSRLGGSYNVQAGFRAQHGDFYRDLIDLLLMQSRSAEAFYILERFRAQIFLTMLAERDTAFTADIPQDLDRDRRRLGAFYDRTLKGLAEMDLRDNGEEIKAIRNKLQRLEDEAGDIEARIRSASPKFATLRYPHPLDAAATQQMLDPGTLLLSFSVGRDKTTLFALSRSGDLETRILASGEETLRSRTKQLLTLIPEAKGGSSLSEQRRTQLQAISRELYTELLAPVADRIAASERLLILPDGPLHALPFAALMRDAEDGPQYLAAWKPLHVALSATVSAELKQGRRPAGDQNTVPAPLQLAAFGDPVYPPKLAALKIPADGHAVRGDPTVRGAAERGLFDFQPLPHSRREVQGIASLFPEGSARTFLGPEALEERIKSLDANTRILHLAAHGSVDEHLPSGSFIALTIPEQTASEETGPQRDNGLLQVWEIFERVRLNADLVVLSACDTGLGEELGGEGLIGLTRAFQYAGARTVMASLWSVQDQATSELMIRFYRHLRAGLTKDRALQAAQQELIRGPIEVTDDKGERVVKDFSAPYYWAGFQLYGDWQ